MVKNKSKVDFVDVTSIRLQENAEKKPVPRVSSFSGS